jgi:hypothetical protein
MRHASLASLTIGCVGAVLAGLTGVARAAPPPNADMSLAPWYNSLRQPQSGISCCSVADCRSTDSRIQGDHYEVLIEGEWRSVPPEAVLERSDNPTGHAVVCYTPTRGILCFIKAPDA